MGNPELPGSKRIVGFDCDVQAYHIRHCRKNAPVGGLIVKNPRHFIVYRTTASGGIELLRVLHDRMDIESNLEI